MIAIDPLAPLDPSAASAQRLSRSLALEERRDGSGPRRAVIIGLLVLAGALAWASQTPVRETVTAAGRVLPNEGLKPVQHLEGGIVKSVHVGMGDLVERGQALAVIDGASEVEERAKAAARLQAIDAGLYARSIFTAAESEAFDENGDGVRRNGRGSGPGIEDSQRMAALSKLRLRAAQRGVIVAERMRLMAELAGEVALAGKADEELEILRAQLSDYDAALTSGVVRRLDRDRIARDVISVERRLAEQDARRGRLNAAIDETHARERELLVRLRRDALEESSQLKTERVQTLALLAQLDERLSRKIIRAPAAGRIQGLALRGPGQVVTPGQLIAEIVPDDGMLRAFVEVPATRIGALSVGQPAFVKVTTYDSARYGAIDATIVAISPSSAPAEDGSVVYEIYLELASDHVGPRSAGRRIKPGMAVQADVVGDERSVLSYLFKPLRVLRDGAMTEP
ncbi:MAG: HlyD family type I secretion periplasmic adaptor subunit [Pseudomonadota bacterium]